MSNNKDTKNNTKNNTSNSRSNNSRSNNSRYNNSRSNNSRSNNSRNNNSRNNNSRSNNRNYRNNDSVAIIKISELPSDMGLRELNEKLQPWGRIGNINMKKNWGTNIAYVDFYDLDDAEFFIEKLDGTGFEHRILSVKLLKNNIRNK